MARVIFYILTNVVPTTRLCRVLFTSCVIYVACYLCRVLFLLAVGGVLEPHPKHITQRCKKTRRRFIDFRVSPTNSPRA